MAICVSHLHSSMRGSIAGITYLTTPSGAIIARQRVIPVDAPSPMRTHIKSAMIQAVAAWQALTSAQKTAWQMWAQANGTLSGREEFIAGHALLYFGINSTPAGWVSPVDSQTAPDFNGHPAIALSSVPFITALQTGVSFQVQNTSPHSVMAIIELSPMLSNGRNYWKGPYDTTVTQASLILTSIKKRYDFQVAAPGMRFFCRVRAFTSQALATHTGTVISAPFITFSTSVTNP